jgi:cytidylate kinase
MIITISGLPGTETSKVGKLLALENGLRYVSRQNLIMRLAVQMNVGIETIREEESIEKIKELIKIEEKRGDIVLDYPIAAWLLSNANVKVFLQSDKRMRARRLVEKEKIPISEALERIETQERNESKIFLNYFGINIYDLGVYDLIINVDKLKEDGVVLVVRKYIEKSS